MLSTNHVASGSEPNWHHQGLLLASPPAGMGRAVAYKDRLPKASIGKGCIRFKRLGDLDQDVLTTLLRQAVQLMPRS